MRKPNFVLSLIIALFSAATVLADELVIAAFGDSLTQGYGLPAEAGFVPQLEDWLARQGAEVRVINAGVSGDTTAGGLARIDWTLTPDVDGMILTLGGNDILRGLAPAQAAKNLRGIMTAAAKADIAVLLIGVQAPENFGPTYKTEFDAIYPNLAREFDAVFLKSFFSGLADQGSLDDPTSLLAFFQTDGLHPNAVGVAQIVDGIGPAVLELIAKIEAQ